MSEEQQRARDESEGYEQEEERYTPGDNGAMEQTYLLDPDEDFSEEDLLFAENAFEPHMVGDPTPKDGAEPPDVPASEYTTDIATSDPFEAIESGVPYYPPEDPPTEVNGKPWDADVDNGFASSADDVPPDDDAATDRLDFSDLEIEENVKQALFMHSETSDLSIRVQVHEGVAMLRGKVRTLDEVGLVEDIASEVAGVDEVREYLTLDM
jgi:hypothetical protein